MGLKKLFSRIVLAGASLAAGFVPPAVADQSKTYGDYTVHYNAFTTDILPPQVAKGFNITRSRSRGMVNVSIMKAAKVGAPHAVNAKVSGTATNLTGQLKVLDIRMVRESDAVYYISELPVAHEETLDFTLEITPEGESEPYILKFRQQFFTQ